MSNIIQITCARRDQKGNQEYQRVLKKLKSEFHNVSIQIHSISMREIKELSNVQKPRKQLALAMFGVVCLIAGQDRNFPTELVFHKNLEWVQLQSNFCFNFEIVQKLYFKFQELVEKHRLKQFNILNATQVQQEINLQKLDQCPLMNLEQKLIKMLQSSLNALKQYNSLEGLNRQLRKQPKQNTDEDIISLSIDNDDIELNEVRESPPEMIQQALKLDEQITVQTLSPTNTNTEQSKLTPVAQLTPIKQRQRQNFIEKNKYNLSASLSRKKSYDHNKTFDKISLFSKEEEFSLIDKKLHVTGKDFQKKVESFLHSHSSPQRLKTQDSESYQHTLKRNMGQAMGDGPTPKKYYKQCLKQLNDSVVTPSQQEEKINKQIKRIQKEFNNLKWQEYRLSKKWVEKQQKDQDRDKIESYEHDWKKEQFLQERIKQIHLNELKDIIQVRHEFLVEGEDKADKNSQWMLNNKEQRSSTHYLNEKLHFLKILKTDYKEQQSKYKNLVDRYKINIGD